MSGRLYRDAAFADGQSPNLRLGVSVLVDAGRVVWIRPSEAEDEIGPDVEVVDASGTTIVPGMVDCHSHLTLPGGAHWLDHVSDSPDQLIATAEDNGRLLNAAGVRWARDVGAPTGRDPVDGVVRPLNLAIKRRWSGQVDRPHVRAAGTFVTRSDEALGEPDQRAKLVAAVNS